MRPPGRGEQNCIAKGRATMTSLLPTGALTAFDLLFEQLEGCLQSLHDQIGQAARAGAYDQAGQLLERARNLSALRKDLEAFETRFGQLVEIEDDEQDEVPQPAGTKRFRKGLKTPQEGYRIPILRALAELGGRSELHPVLDRVYELMKGRLNEYDHMVLPSDAATPRWRNTAQWARNSLREEGLIRDDTPRSIWEITEAGRQLLEKQG